MSILPYSPMERGFLTGKFHSGSKFNAGDTRATSKWMQSDNMHKLEKLIAVLQEMADSIVLEDHDHSDHSVGSVLTHSHDDYSHFARIDIMAPLCLPLTAGSMARTCTQPGASSLEQARCFCFEVASVPAGTR